MTLYSFGMCNLALISTSKCHLLNEDGVDSVNLTHKVLDLTER